MASEEVVVSDANFPVALVFAADGRLFYTEHCTGDVRVVTPDGQLLREPFAQMEMALYLDWGLTGLALDPDFNRNHYVYAYLSELDDPDALTARPKVVRFTEEDNRGVDPKVIVGDLPETFPEGRGVNTNGHIHFGPDGFLYLTVGDYDASRLAQDLSTPVGKIRRLVLVPESE